MGKILAEYPSSSSSNIYHIQEGKDGVIYCDCPGWKFNGRTCKHLKDYQGGAHDAEKIVAEPAKPKSKKAKPVRELTHLVQFEEEKPKAKKTDWKNFPGPSHPTQDTKESPLSVFPKLMPKVGNMKEVFDLLDKVEGLPGRIEKDEALRSNISEEMKFVFETALNPFYNYMVIDFDDSKDYRKDVPTLAELQDLRNKLLDRSIPVPKDLLRSVCLTANKQARKWLVRMFQKNLNCGVSNKGINKIYNNLIPEFNIALCESYGNPGIFKMGTWIAEPKYDGNRAIAIVDKRYNIAIVSRSNKPFNNVEHIIEQLQALCKASNLNDVIIDGELYSPTGKWNEGQSILTTESKMDNAGNICYFVFDMVKGEDWRKQATPKLTERKELIKLVFSENKTKNIRMTPWFPVKTEDEAKGVYKQVLKEGYEGIVLKHMGSGYSFKRTEAWLKWKPIETYDLTITGWEVGEGKNAGRLGAFLCELNGVRTKVGGGYSDKQRTEFWKNKESMKGMTMEVQCQEVTKDGVLRFPVFLRLRTDK